jgi:hypothetical protein
MKRFLIYNPKSQTYIRLSKGGWTSGHAAEAVNSFSSLENARAAALTFDSLHDCQIVEVEKTVTIIKNWELV